MQAGRGRLKLKRWERGSRSAEHGTAGAEQEGLANVR